MCRRAHVYAREVFDVERIISFLSGEYGSLQLQKDRFDIVLINGMVNFTEPEQVIAEALSLAAEDGTILCYVDDAPFLEDIFRLYFEECDEYMITPLVKVLAAKAPDQSWSVYEPDIAAQAQSDLREAERLYTQENLKRQILTDIIGRLHKDAQNAAELGKIDLKLQLIEEKEKMTDLLFCLYGDALKP